MATYKNISDNWYISVDSGVGTIYIDGNLDVTGNITYVSELAVNDAFIIVAANNPGSVNSMGMVATRNANTGAYAGLRFSTITNEWEISPSVFANGAPITAYSGIATGNGAGFVGGTNTQVQFNQAGLFGASANLTFDYANSVLTVRGAEVLGNIGSNPTAPANSVALYNKAVGIGRTGLYVIGTTPTINNDELISVTQARLFAIIF